MAEISAPHAQPRRVHCQNSQRTCQQTHSLHRSVLMHPSSVTSPRHPSAPPAPAPLPPGPHHNASPRALNTEPYPAPRRHADAAHRKSPPPSFPFSCSQKSRCLTSLSSDRSPGRESPRCLPPATSHFHDRHAVAPATSPVQSTPLRRSPPPAAF